MMERHARLMMAGTGTGRNHPAASRADRGNRSRTRYHKNYIEKEHTTMKKLIATTVLALTIAGLYPNAGTVTAIDRETDTVTVQVSSGHLFEFLGAEDYDIGDTVAMIMSDNGTPDTILDDLILDCRYAG